MSMTLEQKLNKFVDIVIQNQDIDARSRRVFASAPISQENIEKVLMSGTPWSETVVEEKRNQRISDVVDFISASVSHGAANIQDLFSSASLNDGTVGELIDAIHYQRRAAKTS